MKLSDIVPSSTGDVPKILREQVAGHPDVEVISVAGVRPVGRVRNEGLLKATGDYVWFVDGDDVVAPWTMDAIRPGSDIVMFGCERFAGGGVPSFSRTAAAAWTYDLDRREDAKAALQLAIDGLIAWSAWYRRAAFADCRFGPYRNCEDTLWTAFPRRCA